MIHEEGVDTQCDISPKVSVPTLIRFGKNVVPGPRKLFCKIMSTNVFISKDCFQQMPVIFLLLVCVQVQDIVLNLFVQRTLPAEIRMLACIVLLETKPSIALISVISEVLLEEADLQVASFSYSLLKGIAKSRTPDNQHL